MPKGGGCPEKQCPQGYKSAADKTHTAGGYGFHSKRPCLRRPNTRIPAATEARTNTACTLRRRRSVVPIPSVFADNPLSRPHAICRGWWRQVNSHNSPMSAASRRREAAYGTKRRRSECASFWPLVRIAERGSAFWSAMATEVASGCDQIRVGFRRAWLMSCSFRPGSTGSLDGPGNGLRRR